MAEEGPVKIAVILGVNKEVFIPFINNQDSFELSPLRVEIIDSTKSTKANTCDGETFFVPDLLTVKLKIFASERDIDRGIKVSFLSQRVGVLGIKSYFAMKDEHSGEDTQSLSIHLTTSLPSPQFAFNPSQLDFGALPENCCKDRNLRLTCMVDSQIRLRINIIQETVKQHFKFCNNFLVNGQKPKEIVWREYRIEVTVDGGGKQELDMKLRFHPSCVQNVQLRGLVSVEILKEGPQPKPIQLVLKGEVIELAKFLCRRTSSISNWLRDNVKHPKSLPPRSSTPKITETQDLEETLAVSRRKRSAARKAENSIRQRESEEEDWQPTLRGTNQYGGSGKPRAKRGNRRITDSDCDESDVSSNVIPNQAANNQREDDEDWQPTLKGTKKYGGSGRSHLKRANTHKSGSGCSEYDSTNTIDAISNQAANVQIANHQRDDGDEDWRQILRGTSSTDGGSGKTHATRANRRKSGSEYDFTNTIDSISNQAANVRIANHRRDDEDEDWHKVLRGTSSTDGGSGKTHATRANRRKSGSGCSEYFTNAIPDEAANFQNAINQREEEDASLRRIQEGMIDCFGSGKHQSKKGYRRKSGRRSIEIDVTNANDAIPNESANSQNAIEQRGGEDTSRALERKIKGANSQNASHQGEDQVDQQRQAIENTIERRCSEISHSKKVNRRGSGGFFLEDDDSNDENSNQAANIQNAGYQRDQAANHRKTREKSIKDRCSEKSHSKKVNRRKSGGFFLESNDSNANDSISSQSATPLNSSRLREDQNASHREGEGQNQEGTVDRGRSGKTHVKKFNRVKLVYF